MPKAPSKLRFAVVAVDVVLFSFKDGKLSVLLDKVDRPPHYTNIEACIGGVIEVNETAEMAIDRHLGSYLPTRLVHLEQLYTFSDLNRDKRNRVISVGYIGLVEAGAAEQVVSKTARWCPVNELPKLAYDHREIIQKALTRLKGKLSYTNLVQFLLPKHFTLTELQTVYEAVLGEELDKRNFRKKISALEIVKDTGRVQEGVKNRPAALFEFKQKKPQEFSAII